MGSCARPWSPAAPGEDEKRPPGKRHRFRLFPSSGKSRGPNQGQVGARKGLTAPRCNPGISASESHSHLAAGSSAPTCLPSQALCPWPPAAVPLRLPPVHFANPVALRSHRSPKLERDICIDGNFSLGFCSFMILIVSLSFREPQFPCL